jgi:hypothetical protein
VSGLTKRLERLERHGPGTQRAIRFIFGNCEWEDVSPGEQEALKRLLSQMTDEGDSSAGISTAFDEM